MMLTTQEILNIVTILRKYVEQKGIYVISFIPEDYYYQTIWPRNRNLTQVPEIFVGSLNDEIEFLKNELSGDYLTDYSFVWVGAIFTAIGAVMPKLPYPNSELKGSEKITFEEIYHIISILLTQLQTKYYKKVSFEGSDDYYQKIAHADRDLEHAPKITIGYLSEDMRHLKELLSSREPIPYDFERLGAILTAWGHALSNS